jgi:hypothetical protein
LAGLAFRESRDVPIPLFEQTFPFTERLHHFTVNLADANNHVTRRDVNNDSEIKTLLDIQFQGRTPGTITPADSRSP